MESSTSVQSKRYRAIYFFLYSIARAAARSRACVSTRGRGGTPPAKNRFGGSTPRVNFGIFGFSKILPRIWQRIPEARASPT